MWQILAFPKKAEKFLTSPGLPFHLGRVVLFFAMLRVQSNTPAGKIPEFRKSYEWGLSVSRPKTKHLEEAHAKVHMCVTDLFPVLWDHNPTQ